MAKSKGSKPARTRAPTAPATSDLPDTVTISEAAVLRELASIAFANMRDYLQQTEDGNLTVDISELDSRKAAAVQELASDTTETGSGEKTKTVRRLRIKLIDKRSALIALGKHLGLFNPRRDRTPANAQTSDADLQARACDLIRALREAGVDLHAPSRADR